jgi:uncharacterized protein (TIGR02145 family)
MARFNSHSLKNSLLGFTAVAIFAFASSCEKNENKAKVSLNRTVPDTISAAANELSADTLSDNTFIDIRDGNKYKQVKIGEQIWMAENLNYATDNSWCYGNDSSNCTKYGRLYSWKVAMSACPAGWHLSTGKDWDNLIEITVGNTHTDNGYLLKSKSGWTNEDGSSGNGTDAFGFSALPGGKRFYENGRFYNIGEEGTWWTDMGADKGDKDDDDFASVRFLNSGARYKNLGWDGDDIRQGYSVRCVLN